MAIFLVHSRPYTVGICGYIQLMQTATEDDLRHVHINNPTD